MSFTTRGELIGAKTMLYRALTKCERLTAVEMAMLDVLRLDDDVLRRMKEGGRSTIDGQDVQENIF